MDTTQINFADMLISQGKTPEEITKYLNISNGGNSVSQDEVNEYFNSRSVKKKESEDLPKVEAEATGPESSVENLESTPEESKPLVNFSPVIPESEDPGVSAYRNYLIDTKASKVNSNKAPIIGAYNLSDEESLKQRFRYDAVMWASESKALGENVTEIEMMQDPKLVTQAMEKFKGHLESNYTNYEATDEKQTDYVAGSVFHDIIDGVSSIRNDKSLKGSKRREAEREFMDRYVEEFKERLPEDKRDDEEYLEKVSEAMYSRFGFRMNFDGDNVYNETANPLLAPLAGAAATTLDMISGVASVNPIAMIPAWIKNNFDDDPSNNNIVDAITEIDQALADASKNLRGYTRDYQDVSVFSPEDWSDSGVHMLGLITQTLGDVAPYMAAAAVSPTVMVGSMNVGAGITLGSNAFLNTFIDSYREDEIAIKNNETPVFDFSASGQASRFIFSLGTGVLETGTGLLFQGAASRAVGKGGGIHDVFRKIFVGEKNPATRAQILKIYATAAGADAILEGGEEAAVALYQGWAQSELGNVEQDWDQVWDNVSASFQLGVVGGGAIGTISSAVGAKKEISELPTGSRISTENSNFEMQIERAASSKGDEAEVAKFWFGLGDNNVDFESQAEFNAAMGGTPFALEEGDKYTTANSARYEEEVENHKKTNKDKYKALMFRNPKDWARLQEIDRRISDVLAKGTRAEDMSNSETLSADAKEAASKSIPSLQRQYIDLVKERRSIYTSFEFDGNFTIEEKIKMDDSIVANRLGQIDQDIRDAESKVAFQEENKDTKSFNPLAKRRAEAEVESLQKKKQNAESLVTEVNSARDKLELLEKRNASPKKIKEATEIVSSSEQQLADLLGVKTKSTGNSRSTERTSQAPSKPTSVWSAEEQAKNHFEDAENKGSTFTLDGINHAGRPMASVSIFNERSKVVDGDMSQKDLEAELGKFKEENADILDGNEDILAVGTFYSNESNQTFIDLSAVVDKKSAEELGKAYNQESVWDLELMEGIDTGGDGGALDNPKSEAERVKDIRDILSRLNESQRAKALAQRGIEGKYTDYRIEGDEGFGVKENDLVDKKTADFINKKLAKTLQNVVPGDVSIRIHNTAESGNYARQGGLDLEKGVVNGLAVTYEDGSAVIHFSPEALKSSGKSAESVLIEETLHLAMGPTIRNMSPKKTSRVISDLKGITKRLAKTNPELQGLIDQATNKSKQYRENNVSENEVAEEVIFEYISELSPFLDPKALSVQDQSALIRVVNEVLSALGLPSISSSEDAINMLKRASEMYREGKSMVDAPTDGTVDSERASYSEKGFPISALPEEEPITIMFSAPTYYRSGQLSGLQAGTLEKEMTFNGKWHFINWWKKATKMGKLPYSDFRIFNTYDGSVESLNVDQLKRWKLKPAKKKETEREKKTRLQKEKNELLSTIYNMFRDEYGVEFGMARKTQEAYESVASMFMSEEELQEHKDFEGDVWSPKKKGVINLSFLTNEQLVDFIASQEEFLGIRPKDSGSSTVSENANEYLFNINKVRSIEDLDERVSSMKKYLQRYKCGGDTNTCIIRGDKAYLATYMEMVADALNGDFTVNSAAELLQGMVLFQNDLRIHRRQRSLADVDIDNMELAQRATDLISNRYKDTPGVIPANSRDFQSLFLGIAAITSNGNRALPNLKIALRLHDSILKALEGGAPMKDALRPDIIEGIRQYNPEVTRGEVRAGRGQHVADELLALLEYADRFYDVETGRFDSDRFSNGLTRKAKGKEGPQARYILGKGQEGDAEKIGEFLSGILGKGNNSFLAKELWVGRVMAAMQGNFDLNIDSEQDQMLLNYGEVPNIQEYLQNQGVTEDQARQALKEVGTTAWDTTTDPTDIAIGGLLHIKYNPETSINNRRQAVTLFNKLIGRDQLYNPKSDPKVTRDVLKRTTDLINASLSPGAKKWTPFSVQQALWESAQETMGYFRDGEYTPVDYLTRLDQIESEDTWHSSPSLFMDPGVKWWLDSNENSKKVSSERASMQIDMFSNDQKNLNIQAHESPLFRTRTMSNTAVINGQEMSDEMVHDALLTDATSRKIMGEENEVKEGDIVAVRLNLNVKNNTGVPVQTIHDKTASGKALQYSGAVTLKNVTLDVNQSAREKIVTFRENKFPMAAVRGEFVSKGVEEADLDGVRATFNPFREHLFVDAAGRPIKSAEEATVIGNNVILRGKIEYYDPSGPVAQRGLKETDKNKSERLDKGNPKYEGNLRRFKAFSERALGVTYETREDLEDAYENLPVSSKVALSESEVAERMATANERASITEFTKDKRMRGRARKAAGQFGGTTRADIVNNPSNYIKPQKIKEIKEDLTAYTDGELVSFMTDESIGRLSQRNDDIGVLAGAELLSRAIAKGETERIPGLIAELAAIGTSAGRILRHFRELKNSNPRGLASIIESAVIEKGNKLSEAQSQRLNDLCDKLFAQQAKVENLMKRAIAGEEVDAEFERALKEMQATERELDTFTNAVIEKDWGTIFKQLVQGNLLTPFSQIVNVGANMVNAFGKVVVDTASLPVEYAMVKLGNVMGKNLEMKRKPSLMAYMYAMKRFGAGFVEAADQIVTGQDKEISEWRINRGFAPYRSIMAAWNNDLPQGPDGKGSPTQKAKLIIQGTLGIPAETMFRFLSLGDIPFRRWAEAKELYQIGLNKGLSGKELERFLKFPNKKDLEIARIEGRKLTFQEEGFVSGATNRLVSSLEGAMASGLQMIPGVKDGSKFARALFGVILPYRSTPANILQETFTWVNPYVGIVRMSKDLENKDVTEASKTMTKMMLGAVTLEAAMMMIKEGIISGPVDWQDDEKRNMAYDLFPPSSVNVSALKRLMSGGDPSHKPDDVFMRYDKMGMFGAIMATAVQSIDSDDLADIKNREYGGPIDFTSHMISDFFGASSVSSISAMMEQSFVQGLNQFLQILIGDNVERDLERFITTAFRAGSAAVLPNTLTSLYKSQRLLLPDTRTTKDMTTTERILTKFKYTLKERTFGLSEVPIRVDWKGQDIKQTPRGANGFVYQMFDLSRAQMGSADPLSNEVWRLYESTEDLADICSTPGYAEKRAVAVPNITSKKDLRLAAALPKQYTWMNDQEFQAESVYLNVEQINRLMKISGKNRYDMALTIINSPEYKSANDQDRLEMLSDVADEFNGAKEYNEEGFEPHTIELFNIIQDIYDGRQ